MRWEKSACAFALTEQGRVIRNTRSAARRSSTATAPPARRQHPFCPACRQPLADCRCAALKAAADGGFAYDQMLEAGNKEGEALIMGAVTALVTQTASIERAVTVLGLTPTGFEGSDSLDNPSAVFQ